MMQARKEQYLGGSDLGDGLPPMPVQDDNHPAGVNHGVEVYALADHVSWHEETDLHEDERQKVGFTGKGSGISGQPPGAVETRVPGARPWMSSSPALPLQCVFIMKTED